MWNILWSAASARRVEGDPEQRRIVVQVSNVVFSLLSSSEAGDETESRGWLFQEEECSRVECFFSE